MALIDDARRKGSEMHAQGISYTEAMGRCPWKTAGVRQAFAEGWVEADRIAKGDPHTPEDEKK